MVGVIDDSQLFYPLGTRIKIGNNYGTVKYVGEVGLLKYMFSLFSTIYRLSLAGVWPRGHLAGYRMG